MGDNLRLRYGDLHFDLKGARLKIGRVAAGNDIQVDDTMVSSKHLTIHNGKLTDTKSTNGTWINNVKIAKETKIALKAGDVIMLGKQGNPNTTLFVVENVVPPIVQEADDTSPPLPVGELKSKQPELTVLNAGRLEAVPMSSTTDSLPPPVPHSPMVEANSNAAEPLTQPYAPVAKRELKNRDDDHDFDIKLSGPSADINLLTLNLTTDNIVVNNDANNNDNPTPALNIDVPPSPHMHAPSLLSPSALKSPSLLLSPTADTVSPSIAPTHKTSSLSDPVVNGFDPTAVWSDLAIYEKREEAGPFAPDSQVVGCPQRSPDSEPRSTDPAGCASSSSSSRSTRSTELEDLDGSVATEPGQFSSVSSASVSVSGLPPSHSPANHAPAGLLAAAPDYLVDDTTGDAALDLTHPGDEPSDVIHFALDADPDPAPAPAPGLVLRARESPTLRHIPTSSKEPTSEPIEGGGVGGTSRGHGVVGGAGLLRERDSLVTAGVEVGYTGKKKKLLKKGGLEKGGAPDSNWQDWKYKYDEVEQRCSDLEFLLRYGSTKEEKREAQENDLLRAETQSLKRELEKRDKIVEGLQLQFDSERAKCAQLSQELAVARLLIAQLHAATNSSNNAALASPTTTARPRDDEGGQASANAFAATAIVPPLAKALPSPTPKGAKKTGVMTPARGRTPVPMRGSLPRRGSMGLGSDSPRSGRHSLSSSSRLHAANSTSAKKLTNAHMSPTKSHMPPTHTPVKQPAPGKASPRTDPEPSGVGSSSTVALGLSPAHRPLLYASPASGKSSTSYSHSLLSANGPSSASKAMGSTKSSSRPGSARMPVRR